MDMVKKGNTAVVRSQDIALGQYSATWNSQEYSAYRDANGLLHRNSMESRPPKCEFYTKNMMTGSELATFVNRIYSAIGSDETSQKEKKITNAQIFIPELNSYVTDDVYLADFTPTIDHIDEKTNTIYYKSCRIALIGYGNKSSYRNIK